MLNYNSISSCRCWLNFKSPVTSPVIEMNKLVFRQLFDKTESKTVTPTGRLHNKSIKHPRKRLWVCYHTVWHEQFHSNGGVVTYFSQWQLGLGNDKWKKLAYHYCLQNDKILLVKGKCLPSKQFPLSYFKVLSIKYPNTLTCEWTDALSELNFFKGYWLGYLFCKFQWCGRRSALVSGPSA